MYRTLYPKAQVQWELFCDLCGASKGWVECRQCPISLSRLTTHARLGNETITNKFYRYILSNLKGNQKSKWKLCLRKAERKQARKKWGSLSPPLPSPPFICWTSLWTGQWNSRTKKGLCEISLTAGEKKIPTTKMERVKVFMMTSVIIGQHWHSECEWFIML